MMTPAASSGDPLDRVVTHLESTSFDALPAYVVERTKTFLLDTFGVGIAGSSGTGVERLIDLATGWGAAPEARTLLSGRRMSAQSAAIVNAYQIHCLEFDCVHEAAVLHPMATILAAVFAWAEREKLNGRTLTGGDLITALALGVDVSTMLGIVTDAPLRFFRPATAGGFGAAAAIGKLAGFDAKALKDALGAQYAQTCGTLQPHVEGSPMLGLQVGFNARAAIVACDLAAAGFRAPHDILTGPYGYFPLFEENDYDLEPFLNSLGRDWQMSHMSHKPYPSGRLTHGAVDGLGRLMHEYGFTAGDIETIACDVPPLVNRLVGRPDLAQPAENYAKLCLRFVVGVFLARGRVDVPDFRGRDALDDPEVHRFAALVDVVENDNPDQNALTPQTLKVRLRSGPEHVIELKSVYGHPDRPLTPEENVAKFRRCCGYGAQPLARDRMEALMAAVASLEDEADITRLMDCAVNP